MDRIWEVKTSGEESGEVHLAYSHSQNNILAYAKGNVTHHHELPIVELSLVNMVAEVLGTAGAIIIILTVIRSSTFIITYRVYLALISTIDILLLYVFGGNTFMLTFTGHNTIYDVLLQSDISCRVYHVLFGFVSHLTIWLHVALVVELTVISVFPKKLNSVSSTERAHFLTLFLVTVLLILNMNYFWTIKRQKEPLGLDRKELCYFDARFVLFETQIYPVIESAVIGVIPMVIWICLTVFTARRFYMQGETRPGGLLISTKEYCNISYSISTLYIVGHLPRFIWLLGKFVEHTKESERNPGISTLQNFHTELIDGDPLFNLPLVLAMGIRVIVLVAASTAFRQEMQKAIRKLCCCCLVKKYSLAQGLKPSYNVSKVTLIPRNRSQASNMSAGTPA